ncbi:MAG: hypothetical protein IV090_06840 [Candidatus Sericytochromatia bacterium]|nr:hypothetical protein [Candidatus Sericytochromatia bacterium]
MQIESRPLNWSQASTPAGRLSSAPPLPKPSLLKQFSSDQIQVSQVQGQALPQLEFPFALDVERDATGLIRVGGFPPGCPPDIQTVIASVFPGAQDVQILAETHDRPFDTYTFSVDGALYKSSFLSGGFAPSKKLSIEPFKH